MDGSAVFARWRQCAAASNMCFLGPTWVHIPNGISIGAVVFARLTIVTDRQTDRPRYSVCSNRPRLRTSYCLIKVSRQQQLKFIEMFCSITFSGVGGYLGPVTGSSLQEPAVDSYLFIAARQQKSW